MIYRLKELQGDTIAVPQLVFSKLGIAEEYNVRVALYVLATGITDPDKICADLKLRSRISAESALSFWAGAGLLERYEENAAPGAEPSAPAPMTWAEICAGAGNSTSAACWASPPTSSPWAAARPLPAGTRCTATMTPWYRKLLCRQAPSGTCGTGTAS